MRRNLLKDYNKITLLVALVSSSTWGTPKSNLLRSATGIARAGQELLQSDDLKSSSDESAIALWGRKNTIACLKLFQLRDKRGRLAHT
jgi:hypothetical protein